MKIEVDKGPLAAIVVLLVIFVVMAIYVMAIYSSSLITLMGETKSEYIGVKRVSSIKVKLICRPLNTHLITEDSEVDCNVSLRSEVHNYSYADVIIQAYNTKNILEPEWRCSSLIFNISPNSFTVPIKCDSFYTFLPSKGSYTFRVIRLHAKTNDENPDIEYEGGSPEFFNKDFDVVSRSEEMAISISRSHLILGIGNFVLGIALLFFVIIQTFKKTT